jgi:putative endopeptidase
MPLKSQISPEIKPGDDFYHYVNKRWLEAHPIPPDKARYGVFQVLNDTNLERIKSLLEAGEYDQDAATIKLVKEYFRAAMDTATIRDTTDQFVQETVSQIKDLKSQSDILKYLAKQHGNGLELLWEMIIEPDDKDSRHYQVRFWQAGLGLPERAYYLEDNQQFKAVRAEYLKFLEKLFRLAGLDDGASRAQRVYDLELALAGASIPAAELRDPKRMYNMVPRQQLSDKLPGQDWDNYLTQIGLDQVKQINISQLDFMAEANQLLSNQPVENWCDYLVAHTLIPLANKLSPPYEDLHFSFYGKVLSGMDQLEPRWLRMARHCMLVLPEPTGRLFVEHNFDESAKANIKDLVSHLQEAFHARLAKLEWMTPKTKEQAYAKLATFLPLLGYPDKWRSYAGLELGPSFVRNYLAAGNDNWRFHANRINQPVDRQEWLMSPALVNAYYWPNTNGITFPAGILQPPFFDASGDFAANYGAIGSVIGHELTHGFDDQGSQFDAQGNLKSWWTPADRQAFEQRAQALEQQYSGYELAGRHLDGKLTLGENIADLGGLLIAFDALEHKLAELGRRDDIDGFSPEQRFFISYAHTEAATTRPELLLQQIVADPHSPGIFRVNGVVPNVDAFYEAFSVKAGEKLYLDPNDRVRIW